MRDILMFWAAKKIDGFRCDMAEMVPVEFWGWLFRSKKTISGSNIYCGNL
jgi:glycosidase